MPNQPSSSLPGIDPSKLVFTETLRPKQVINPEKLVFGRQFTDHMLSIEWEETEGWSEPHITPYQDISLDPATSVLHYGFSAFEGMKAYKSSEGSLSLFRPDKNMARLNRSSASLGLPTFDGKKMIELIKKLVRLDERFIPPDRGYSLYLRPTMIGTQKSLGVGPSRSALLYVIASPVGPYYPTGFKAVSLEALDDRVRAWPGGFGDKKLGANYGPTIVPQVAAAARGHQQVLWLFGPDSSITEVGTMNFFIAVKDPKTERKTLITPPLDGTILPGVTRDSVLDLAHGRLVSEGWDIKEEHFTMHQLVQAVDEGRLIEVFGTGTAAVVSPIRTIAWRGRNINCGLKEGQEAGEIATRMKDWIEGIQFGEEGDHPWIWKV